MSFEREKLEKKNFNVEPDKWELFKKVARIKQGNPSMEIRIFIDKYLEDNKKIVEEIKKGE